MPKKKLCPILSDYRGTVQAGDYTGDIYCQRDECALWDIWTEECAFLSMAHSLGRDIAEEKELKKEKYSPTHIKGGTDGA